MHPVKKGQNCDPSIISDLERGKKKALRDRCSKAARGHFKGKHRLRSAYLRAVALRLPHLVIINLFNAKGTADRLGKPAPRAY